MLSPLQSRPLFSGEECDRIVGVANAGAFGAAGLVRGAVNDNIRRARIAWLDEDGEAAWVFRRLLDAVAAANRDHFRFDLAEFRERMQVAWYGAEDEGHFDWHVDYGDGALAQARKLTLVAQLSPPEAYDGGALETNADGAVREASRARGAAILFPSFTPHRVGKVTRGERYSLTIWAHGPAFR